MCQLKAGCFHLLRVLSPIHYACLLYVEMCKAVVAVLLCANNRDGCSCMGPDVIADAMAR